eukprot:CAMPEP_0115010872 /NCGR_PEP_ID=MMETSP0216-20121206/23608_1 /TAXON_ID=223996 /ORGANISM="Protocruzia adherens, Strain Boccale" /LENGTH=833 /DNA_ID=CAMNT_0002379237 /DNA_START=127 /DNA_END=2628 /DNA_ORIENTATION=+
MFSACSKLRNKKKPASNEQDYYDDSSYDSDLEEEKEQGENVAPAGPWRRRHSLSDIRSLTRKKDSFEKALEDTIEKRKFFDRGGTGSVVGGSVGAVFGFALLTGLTLVGGVVGIVVGMGMGRVAGKAIKNKRELSRKQLASVKILCAIQWSKEHKKVRPELRFKVLAKVIEQAILAFEYPKSKKCGRALRVLRSYLVEDVNHTILLHEIGIFRSQMRSFPMLEAARIIYELWNPLIKVLQMNEKKKKVQKEELWLSVESFFTTKEAVRVMNNFPEVLFKKRDDDKEAVRVMNNFPEVLFKKRDDDKEAVRVMNNFPEVLFKKRDDDKEAVRVMNNFPEVLFKKRDDDKEAVRVMNNFPEVLFKKRDDDKELLHINELIKKAELDHQESLKNKSQDDTNLNENNQKSKEVRNFRRTLSMGGRIGPCSDQETGILKAFTNNRHSVYRQVDGMAEAEVIKMEEEVVEDPEAYYMTHNLMHCNEGIFVSQRGFTTKMMSQLGKAGSESPSSKKAAEDLQNFILTAPGGDDPIDLDTRDDRSDSDNDGEVCRGLRIETKQKVTETALESEESWNEFGSPKKHEHRGVAARLGLAKPKMLHDYDLSKIKQEHGKEFYSRFDRLLTLEAEDISEWDRTFRSKFIRIYKKKSQDAAMNIIKAFVELENIPGDIIYEAIYDSDFRRQWDKMWLVMETCRQEPELDAELIRCIIKAPIGVSNREFLQRRRMLINEPEERMSMIHMESVELPEYPTARRCVRAHTFISGYVIRQVSDNPIKTTVTIISQLDLKGLLPKTLVNMASAKAPADWTKALVKGCFKLMKEKYPERFPHLVGVKNLKAW